MELLFWFCVFGILYAYFGYPLSMYLISRVWPADIKRWAYNYGSERSVSVVITAANEETRIIDKLNNTLALEYPSDKLQIVIALDAPTDRTGQLVDQWMYDIPTECKVDRVDLGIRGGKEAAQLRALEVVKNDIVVFTDTATRLESHTLYQITSNFCDEHIGAVDGMSKVDSKDSSEGLYLRYENKIREWESDTSGLVTFGGCLFAVRRKIIEGYYDMLDRAPVPGFRGDRQSDFRTALITKTAGYHSVLDKEAVALFKDGDESKEFGRKHRTIVRGMANFFDHTYLLNPVAYGLFSYALFCHKLLKWLVPFFMVGAFAINIHLVACGPESTSVFLLYTILGLIQSGFYFLAAVNLKHPEETRKLRIAGFFLMANLAILKAWYSYLKGERYVMWTPTKR